jgi:hypothetical protein
MASQCTGDQPGQRSAEGCEEHPVAERLAEHDLHGPDRRDAEEFEDAQAPVPHGRHSAQGEADVLDDQGQHGRGVEGDRGWLERDKVHHVGGQQRDQPLGGDGVDAAGDPLGSIQPSANFPQTVQGRLDVGAALQVGADPAQGILDRRHGRPGRPGGVLGISERRRELEPPLHATRGLPPACRDLPRAPRD